MDLRLPGVMTVTSYSPSEMDWGEFERAASMFQAVHQGIQWWIGDLGLYGERRFPDQFSQGWLAEQVGRPRTSVRAYMWVCGRIPARRRRSDLGFSHHRAAAALESDAECDAILAKAAKEEWTVAQLRKGISDVTRVTSLSAQDIALRGEKGVRLTAEQVSNLKRLLEKAVSRRLRGEDAEACIAFAQMLAPLCPPLPPTPPSPPISPKKARRERFVAPSLGECRAFGEQIGLPWEEGEHFFDHFTANGWRVSGRTPMADWRCAMKNWRRRWLQQPRPAKSVQSLSQKMLTEAGFERS